MDAKRWQRIEGICNQALELDPARRPAFLAEACAGEEALRQEVESLLARQSQAAGFLETPALDEAARVLAQDRDPKSDLVGRMLHHYRITGRIGAGGMGVVYRAEDSHLGRTVAVKILPDLFARDPKRLKRFEREARLLATLTHPNIALIHGLEEADGRVFLVLEWIEGVTLEERLKQSRMPPDEALKVCCQIAEGLEAAHDRGIIHRDLKPGNVQVTPEGRVKILDFGLAKALHAEEGAADLSSEAAVSMTGSGVILGTVAYMSPEQACGRTIDKRTDIWAFGCVLYECLTGQRVFPGETPTETVAAILRDEPDWNVLPKITPPRVTALLRRCLKKGLNERLHDIADARIEIEEARPGKRPVGKAKRWIAAAAMVVLVLAGHWGWDVVRTRDSRLPPLTVVSLTSYPGNETSPSFSPDGSEIVFAWDGGTGGPPQIYRRLIGSEGQPFRLTTNPAGGSYPAWSPDGKSIAFMRTHADTKKRSIIIISPLGGHERKLTECSALGVIWAPPPIAWTPDSRFLAIVDSATGDLPNALFLVSIETGERRQVTFPLGSKGYGDYGMSFSPDGRNLSFLRSTGHYMWDLFLLPLSEDLTRQGEPRRLTFDNGTFLCGPAWASDGKDLVLAANRGGAARQLWRINVSGREPAQLIPVPYEAGFGLAISCRGDRLVYQTGVLADNDIWKLDLPQRDGQAGFPTILIASSYMDNDPRFSPDGRKVVFQSNRTGTGTQIWVAESSGGNPLLLTRFEANSGGACWSPDGRRIVFDTTVYGNRDIFMVEADGGKPMPLITDPSDELLPRWSRDGKWIYFSSLRSGGYQLWKTPVSGGADIQVTRKGGMAAEESEDGAYLYYTKREFDTGLWRVPTGGGEEVQVVESVVAWNGFSVRRDGIYFVSHTPAAEPGNSPQRPYEVRFHRFADGATQTVAGLEAYYQGLSVSPDERTLLFNRTATRSGIDLMLIESFR